MAVNAANLIEADDLEPTKVTFWTRLRRHRLAVAGMVVCC